MKRRSRAVLDYQCVGCMYGDKGCFKHDDNSVGIGCDKHHAGTIISNIGKVFLGLPNGFNRTDDNKYIKIHIFKTQKDQLEKWNYDTFNVPIWKHKGETGHTFVKGIMPRLSRPFIHIILNCPHFDKIDCIEITDEDISEMD